MPTSGGRRGSCIGHVAASNIRANTLPKGLNFDILLGCPDVHNEFYGLLPTALGTRRWLTEQLIGLPARRCELR